MSPREHDILPTPSEAVPLTRRQVRDLEEPGRSRPRTRSSAKARPPRKSAKSSPQSRRHTGSKLLSLGAMMFAGAILVGTSIPANAFMSDVSAIDPGTPVATKPGQSIAVSDDAQMATASRDSFEVISYADQLRLK